MKTKPLVSIILPCYNSIDFLDERLETILNQSIPDWECIVIDGFSTDGTFEKIKELSVSDTRFKLNQLPPNGPYDAWNKGIELAKGDFIYIATADDTMEQSFLKKMTDVLIQNNECDFAHCCLTIINEKGLKTENQWIDWQKNRFYKDLLSKKHIRIAPYDAYLHAGWDTVYSSVTQLLFKREVFEKVGLYNEKYSPESDFEFGIRLALTCNVVHLPEYLATWRKHQQQLSQSGNFYMNTQFYIKIVKMINSGFMKSKGVGKLKYSSRYIIAFHYIHTILYNIRKEIEKRKILSVFYLIYVLLIIRPKLSKTLFKKENHLDVAGNPSKYIDHLIKDKQNLVKII